MFNGGIKNIYISNNDLNLWFETMLKKYKNSCTYEHLVTVWMMMEGSTVQDDSLQTFLKKIKKRIDKLIFL